MFLSSRHGMSQRLNSQTFSSDPFSKAALLGAACFFAAVFFVLIPVSKGQAQETFNKSGIEMESMDDRSVSSDGNFDNDGGPPVRWNGVNDGSTAGPNNGADMRANAPDFGGNSSYQAQVETRLSDLENQVRNLRGQIEEKDFQIDQLQKKLDRALSDLEIRLNERASAASSSSISASQSSSDEDQNSPSTLNDSDIRDPNAPAPKDSPTQQKLGSLREAPGGVAIPPEAGDAASQYEQAYSQLKSGDYVTAQKSFDRFLKNNPRHPLAGNATYWLGETFYAQQKYDQATRIFAESYKKFPKGAKAPDSLLKMGMSLGNAGKKNEACISFKQLKKQFATGHSGLLRRADQEMERLGCAA
jgi:tol-pal system protein YbgF